MAQEVQHQIYSAGGIAPNLGDAGGVAPNL